MMVRLLPYEIAEKAMVLIPVVVAILVFCVLVVFGVAQCDIAQKSRQGMVDSGLVQSGVQSGKSRIEVLVQMSDESVTYEARYSVAPGTSLKGNLSFLSRGPGFEIAWQGSDHHSGARPGDVLRAALMHLQGLQKTDVASEANAKLIAKLIPAIEEYEGLSPTMGGDLNSLIPEEE